MSDELTLLVLRLVFLLVLWGFIFALVYALRSDLFGAPVRRIKNAGRNDDLIDPFLAEPMPVATAPQQAPTNPVVAGALTEPLAKVPSAAAGPSGTATRLVITTGTKAGVEIPLNGEPLTIGRSSDSSLVIRDEYTSTHHARLVFQNGEWYLHDLDSTNGTFLNARRIGSPVVIPNNTPFTIGKTSFELRR
ncbi:antibiotic biosynthesis regulator FhaB [Klugiella xanthotipulae]|uniref:PSer/pThr/pTyr-binding forkhead associated (FHA) protein n=1 Tax=Klugiella xanthotipulae TaxID=244735 RepID=A0A543I6V1_9MICO|nr:FHA domain-containing protein [Klugiella xanthotipulae]TQM66336.1 pSer/pThr/pTyr-binding forkhead associated (FHA) protein [Klugiella xanthotipulae]